MTISWAVNGWHVSALPTADRVRSGGPQLAPPTVAVPARAPELANAIFEYLEIFHNRQRRHSSLGILTPVEYESLRPTTLSVA